MAPGVGQGWVMPTAICFLTMALALIAGTIVLALIPTYLPDRQFDGQTSTSDASLSAGYASDATDGRLLSVADTSGLSSQLVSLSGVSSGSVTTSEAGFLSSTAAARKKRQTSGSFSCETTTGLTGDLFFSTFTISFKSSCRSQGCRNQFLSKVRTGIRRNYQRLSVNVNVTGVGIRVVQLIFCGFFGSDSSDCTTGTKSNIYLMDRNSTLYTFNPLTYAISTIGTLNCSSSSSLYSIAVQRTGILWALFGDGRLYNYNLATGVCSSTSFVANRSNINLFTMTFLKPKTSSTESLYISKQNDEANTLGLLSTSTFGITTLGNYSSLSTSADLAALKNGRLFGLFELSPFVIAEINPSNAVIISNNTLSVTMRGNNSNYGFASYNSNLFVFEGNNTSTDIHVFSVSSSTLTRSVATVSQIIHGATASTCLGAI